MHEDKRLGRRLAALRTRFGRRASEPERLAQARAAALTVNKQEAGEAASQLLNDPAFDLATKRLFYDLAIEALGPDEKKRAEARAQYQVITRVLAKLNKAKNEAEAERKRSKS